MPMLAEIGTCLLSIHSGDASASVMWEATSEARAGSQFGNADDEFVAAQPSQQVGRLDAGAQPLGELDQQGVARRMSEGVVDVLEVIEIEEHQRKLLSSRAIFDGLVAQLSQLRAVRAARSTCHGRRVGQSGAGCLSLDRQRTEVNAGVDDPLMPAARRATFPEIEGEGPDHPAVLALIAWTSRPSGRPRAAASCTAASADRCRYLRPAQACKIRRRPARADVWTDGDAFKRAGVIFRQAGSTQRVHQSVENRRAALRRRHQAQ